MKHKDLYIDGLPVDLKSDPTAADKLLHSKSIIQFVEMTSEELLKRFEWDELIRMINKAYMCRQITAQHAGNLIVELHKKQQEREALKD